MSEYESHLNRWQSAGLLDREATRRIRAWEREQAQPAGLRWQGIVALTLGGILLACGVVLFVSAHWDKIGPAGRFLLVLAMVTVFHLAAGIMRTVYRGLSTALHALGTISTGAAIALVGQIFNIQEHWPAAVGMWALAAAFAWLFLADEAQQILTLLLVPSWLFCELSYFDTGYTDQNIHLGRFLFVWALFYGVYFTKSKRKVTQGVLLVVAAIAAVFGVILMIQNQPYIANGGTLQLSLRVWNWAAIALLPLFFSLTQLRKCLIPVLAGLILSVLLPWCHRTIPHVFNNTLGGKGSNTYSEPNLYAHALVAAFAVFVVWWGVRLVSRSLVNLGIVYFAASVSWFYFSDLFDKMGRSLGLIGLGVLFLAGGWALERTRRGLVARMDDSDREAAL